MAEVTPPEKSDSPVAAESVAQVAAATKADVGSAVSSAVAALPAEESKVKAFFTKHKTALAVLGALAVISGLLHFVL